MTVGFVNSDRSDFSYPRRIEPHAHRGGEPDHACGKNMGAGDVRGRELTAVKSSHRQEDLPRAGNNNFQDWVSIRIRPGLHVNCCEYRNLKRFSNGSTTGPGGSECEMLK